MSMHLRDARASSRPRHRCGEMPALGGLVRCEDASWGNRGVGKSGLLRAKKGELPSLLVVTRLWTRPVAQDGQREQLEHVLTLNRFMLAKVAIEGNRDIQNGLVDRHLRDNHVSNARARAQSTALANPTIHRELTWRETKSPIGSN